MSCGSGSCGSCGSGDSYDDDLDLHDVGKLIAQHAPNASPPPPATPTLSLAGRIDSISALLRALDSPAAADVDEATASSLSAAFSEIGWALAGRNAQAVKPLLAVFDALGAAAFVDVCARLLALGCTGVLLAWAFDFADHDEHRLVRLVMGAHGRIEDEDQGQGDDDTISGTLQDLAAYVNAQARFHECFPGNSKVGRMLTETDERGAEQ